ncbi:hypothetical protein EGR_10313 [Echinococcus granulosus]|uniref:Uncharacterized protein n=1 Tax=Echinococcus granulosus TaxID=6210 RepID=W6U1B6_ECHGR|nr:hypothetical protein EGR_10313 [Echinococcus granulosus]EUB54828.1 hypothetical protein EGR_10313 [Echinococcus granulosus]
MLTTSAAMHLRVDTTCWVKETLQQSPWIRPTMIIVEAIATELLAHSVGSKNEPMWQTTKAQQSKLFLREHHYA